jgi:hypothetical protein
LLALLGALVVLAGACGGHGSLAAYFDQLAAIDQEFSPRFGALETQYPLALQDPQQTHDFFVAGNAILREGLARVAAVQPPGAARDAHEEYLAAGDALLGALEALPEQLAGVQSANELRNLLDVEDARLSGLFDRFSGACNGLRAIAQGEEIQVELACLQ